MQAFAHLRTSEDIRSHTYLSESSFVEAFTPGCDMFEVNQISVFTASQVQMDEAVLSMCRIWCYILYEEEEIVVISMLLLTV